MRSAVPIHLMGNFPEECRREVRTLLEGSFVCIRWSECYGGGWYGWNCGQSRCGRKSIVKWLVRGGSKNVPLGHWIVNVDCESMLMRV